MCILARSSASQSSYICTYFLNILMFFFANCPVWPCALLGHHSGEEVVWLGHHLVVILLFCCVNVR